MARKTRDQRGPTPADPKPLATPETPEKPPEDLADQETSKPPEPPEEPQDLGDRPPPVETPQVRERKAEMGRLEQDYKRALDDSRSASESGSKEDVRMTKQRKRVASQRLLGAAKNRKERNEIKDFISSCSKH